MPNKIQLNLRNIVQPPDRWFHLGELSALLWKCYREECISSGQITDINNLLSTLFGAPLTPTSSWEDTNSVLQYLGIPYRLDRSEETPYDITMAIVVDIEDGSEIIPMDLCAFNALPVEAYVTMFNDVMPKIFNGTTNAMVEYSKLMEPVMKCIEFLISRNPKWDRELIERDNDAFNKFMLEHGFPYRIKYINDSYTFMVKHNDTNMMFRLGELTSCLGDAASRKVVMPQEEFEQFHERLSGLIFALANVAPGGIIDEPVESLNRKLRFLELPYIVEWFALDLPGEMGRTTYMVRSEMEDSNYMDLYQLNQFVERFIDKEGL